MAKDEDSTKQLLEYYSFWLFEYTQRNELHREEMKKLEILQKAYPALMSEEENRMKNILELCFSTRNNGDDSRDALLQIKELSASFLKKSKPCFDLATDIENIDTALGHPFLPKVCRWTKTLSSDDILNMLIKTGVIQKNAKPEYSRKKLYSSIGYNHEKRKAEDTSSEQERYIKLEVDTDCNIDTILTEIVSAFWDKKVQRLVLEKVEQIRLKEQRECSEKIEYKVFECLSPNDLVCFDKMHKSMDELIECKIRHRIKERGRGFDLDDTPRAIGLWLWDYITNKYGKDKPPHKSYAEARRVFKEKFDYVTLGYHDTESGTYRNWYHRTAACIEACDVLSFKGDGRKKKTKA